MQMSGMGRPLVPTRGGYSSSQSLALETVFVDPTQPNQYYILTPVVVNMASASQSTLQATQIMPPLPPAPNAVQYAEIPRNASVTLPKASAESTSRDSGKNVDMTKYKTRMCRNWLQSHCCPYGNVCMYAHGEHELRKVTENTQVMESLYKLAQQMMCKQGARSTEQAAEGMCEALRPGAGKKKKKSRAKRRKAAQAAAAAVTAGTNLVPSLSPELEMEDEDDELIEGFPLSTAAAFGSGVPGGSDCSTVPVSPGYSFGEVSDETVLSEESMRNMLAQLNLNLA